MERISAIREELQSMKLVYEFRAAIGIQFQNQFYEGLQLKKNKQSKWPLPKSKYQINYCGGLHVLGKLCVDVDNFLHYFL